MLSDDRLVRIASEVGDVHQGHQVLSAHETLQRLLIASRATDPIALDRLANAAGDSLEAVLADAALWSALEAFQADWDWDDTQYVEQLVRRYGDDLLAAEAELLADAGLVGGSATPLLSALLDGASGESNRPGRATPSSVRTLAEALQAATSIDEYEEVRAERKTRRRLGLIMRAAKVVGGATLFLVDAGATAGAAISNPLALVPGTAVCLVSMKAGSNYMDQGVRGL